MQKQQTAAVLIIGALAGAGALALAARARAAVSPSLQQRRQALRAFLDAEHPALTAPAMAFIDALERGDEQAAAAQAQHMGAVLESLDAAERKRIFDGILRLGREFNLSAAEQRSVEESLRAAEQSLAPGTSTMGNE